MEESVVVLVGESDESEVESRFLCQAEAWVIPKVKEMPYISGAVNFWAWRLVYIGRNSLALTWTQWHCLKWVVMTWPGLEMSSSFTALFIEKYLKISNSQQANKLLENNLFIKWGMRFSGSIWGHEALRGKGPQQHNLWSIEKNKIKQHCLISEVLKRSIRNVALKSSVI